MCVTVCVCTHSRACVRACARGPDVSTRACVCSVVGVYMHTLSRHAWGGVCGRAGVLLATNINMVLLNNMQV